MHIYDKQCGIMQKNQWKGPNFQIRCFTMGRQELCAENAQKTPKPQNPKTPKECNNYIVRFVKFFISCKCTTGIKLRNFRRKKKKNLQLRSISFSCNKKSKHCQKRLLWCSALIHLVHLDHTKMSWIQNYHPKPYRSKITSVRLTSMNFSLA